MSRADDASLLAMRDARMSPASIALTMGWSVERVKRRLTALDAPAQEASEAEAEADSQGEADEAEPPIDAGYGRVERSFNVQPKGFGADCRLGDGRNVFVITGETRLEIGARVPVTQGGGCWRLGDGAGHE